MPITQSHVDYIRKLLSSGASGRAAISIKKLHPADIAELFANLTPTETKNLIGLLTRQDKAGEVLAELPEGILGEVLDLLDDRLIASLLQNQDATIVLQFLRTLPEEKHEPILNLLSPADRVRIDRLLIYPEDSAGYCMATSFMKIGTDLSAEEAVEEIRQQSEKVDVPFYVYVVDDDERLIGVVPLRRLVTCPPNTPVRDLMLEDPFTVDVNSDREEAATIARKYDIMAVPVVDDSHHLMGVIPGDSLFDVMEKEATEDMYRMAGLAEEDRIFTPVTSSFRKRFPWIWINLLTAFVASTVVRAFQGTIEAFATLAAFMPVVAGMSGNTGNQSLVVITRGIALGEMEFSSGLKAMLKEASVGIFLGAVAGLVAAGVALMTTSGDVALKLGLVIFLSLVANMGLAGLLGAAIPLILRGMGRDPAMGSNILLTACTDSIGYLLLLGLALLIIM
jgi:magnesium transporter